MDDDELLEEELDDEESLEGDDDLDGDEELDDEIEDDIGDDAVTDDSDDEDDETADDVPAAKAKRSSDDDEDDEDPDDVEADLDTILKDRIAAGDDEDEEDEIEDAGVETGERVAAKTAEEFTCPTCFLIVHPRQFGRPDALSCPEGYDPCEGIKIVTKLNSRAKKS